ncbi:MAG: amino acid--tRNA ligase-related protein [Rhodospirillales bacterium]
MGRERPDFPSPNWPTPAGGAGAARPGRRTRCTSFSKFTYAASNWRIAFEELTDAAEQRARFVADRARRHAMAATIGPLDEDFLAALNVMPSCAGIALGFDRLAMLAAGADSIEQVLWLPGMADPIYR